MLHLKEVGRWAGAAWVVSRALGSPLQRRTVRSIFEISNPLAHWGAHRGSPEALLQGDIPARGALVFNGRCQMHCHV